MLSYEGVHWPICFAFAQPHLSHATQVLTPHSSSLAALRWFYIGVSLAPLLQRPAGVPFLRALLQLQEEYQYHFREPSENQKAFRARSATGQQRVMMGDHGDHSDMLKPMLLRVEGKVTYEYLFTPHLAHAISGIQVVLSLCELMSKVYRKLVECTAVPGASQDVLEAVSKADAYFEEHFLAPAAKHADAHAKSAMRSSLGGVDPLFARLWGQSVIADE